MPERNLKPVRPRPRNLRIAAAMAVAALLAALGGQVAYGARLEQAPTPGSGAVTTPPELPMPAQRRATIDDPNCEQPSADADLRALDGLGRTVAAASGGQAHRTVVDQQCFRGTLQNRSVILLVRLPSGGHFEVRVYLAGSNSGQAASAGWYCAFAANDKIDNKPCTQYSISARQSLTSSTVNDFGARGRATLDYAVLTLSEAELSVHIDNYAELPSGEKAVGPNWRQAGYTPAKLREIVNKSGLLN